MKPIPKRASTASKARAGADAAVGTSETQMNTERGSNATVDRKAGKFSRGHTEPTGATASSATTAWPPEVRKWATDAFQQCQTREQCERMKLLLRDAVREAREHNALHGIDWSNKAIPRLPEWDSAKGQEEKLQASSDATRKRRQSEQMHSQRQFDRDASLCEHSALPAAKRQSVESSENFSATQITSTSAAESAAKQQSHGASSKTKQQQFYCSNCDTWMTSRHDYEQHIRGSKHRHKLNTQHDQHQQKRKKQAQEASQGRQHETLSHDQQQQEEEMDTFSNFRGPRELETTGDAPEPEVEAPGVAPQTDGERKRLEQMTLGGALENERGNNASAAPSTHREQSEHHLKQVEQTHPSELKYEEENDVDLVSAEQPIVGHCRTLEKSYFRLKASPEPAQVRPPDVIEQALGRLQNMDPQPSWHYINDQLKAMRQDLTVQHHRSNLTVRVHEVHARRALDVGAWQEYAQCQDALRRLYAEGCKGHEEEFVAYRILWATATWEKAVSTAMGVSRASRDDVLSDLRLASRWRSQNNGVPPAMIAHALSARDAANECNLPRFVVLTRNAPNLSARLLELALEPLRMRCVDAIVRAVRQTLSMDEARMLLGFDSADSCEQWLRARGARFDENSNLDCKASINVLHEPSTQTPQKEQADGSLGLQDFMVSCN